MFIVIAVFRSIMDSQKAKAKSVVNETKRKGSDERLEDYVPPKQSAESKPKEQPITVEDIFRQLFTGQQTEQKPKTKPAKTPKEQKAKASQPVKSKPKEQKQENHERLKPNVKAKKASITSIKNVREDQEKDEHRIELNPHIHQRKTTTDQEKQKTLTLKHDSDMIVQGIIWSEILAKPKSLRR